MHTKEEKYMKVIESIGELLLNKDSRIQFNELEIKQLKRRIETIESYANFYSSDEITNENYKENIK